MPGPAILDLRIRWRDVDAFAHVNNAVYLEYLGEARDAFLLDHSDAATVDRFVVRRLEIDYVDQLVYVDAAVRVEVRLEAVGSSSVRTVETVRAARDGRLVVEARGVTVHCDPTRSRAERIPDDLRARLLAGLGV